MVPYFLAVLFVVGVVTPVAGLAGQVGRDEGTGTNAKFSNPKGLTVTQSGLLLMTDSNNHIVLSIATTGYY